MKPRGFTLAKEFDDGSEAQNHHKLSFANAPKQPTSDVRAFEASLTGQASGNTMMAAKLREVVPINDIGP